MKDRLKGLAIFTGIGDPIAEKWWDEVQTHLTFLDWEDIEGGYYFLS